MKLVRIGWVACAFVVGCQISPGSLLGKKAQSPGSASPSSAAPAGEAGGEANAQPAPRDTAVEQAREAWRMDSYALKKQLETLRDAATEHPNEGATSPDQRADWRLELLKAAPFGELAKACAAGKYKGASDADATCPLVVKSDEILKNGVREWATLYAQRHLHEQTSHEIRKTHTWSVKWALEPDNLARERAYFTSFVKKYFEGIGEPVPESLLKQVDAYVADVDKAIQEVMQVTTLTKSAGADPGAEAAIRSAYLKDRAGLRIERVTMTDAAWKIVKNDYGTTLRHYKDGKVVIRAKSGAYCLEVHASVGQLYIGGGAFAREYGVDLFDAGTVVKCP